MSSPSPSDSFDPSSVDLDAFQKDIKALRAKLDASYGEEDLAHLRRFERIGRLSTLLGVATGWVMPNPISALALAWGRSARWGVMHHVGHRGYDRVPNVPRNRTSKVFAIGKRRFLDWADWMVPEAWIYEHNVLHHSHTGEALDPDLIERNVEYLQKKPLAYRWATLAVLAVAWRAAYYAPETLDAWRKQRQSLAGANAKPLPPKWWELLTRCYLPYATLTFVALPLPFLLLGPWAAFSMLCNSLIAEALCNFHTFLMVGPNHTADDLYRFDKAPEGRGERYLFQVISTANYNTGSELTDYAHLWLNYQIEHHLFPDIPMLKYRALQPEVRALCEKHGIPYVQQSVWTRARKMVDVIVGKTKMRKLVQGRALDRAA